MWIRSEIQLDPLKHPTKAQRSQSPMERANPTSRKIRADPCVSVSHSVAMVRWVDNAMVFAMYLAFFAIFAVKLRWISAVQFDSRGSRRVITSHATAP